MVLRSAPGLIPLPDDLAGVADYQLQARWPGFRGPQGLYRASASGPRRSDSASLDVEDEDAIPFQTDRFRLSSTPGYRGQAVDLQDRRVAEGLRLTIEMLGLMRQRALAADTRFAVILIPTKELALSDAVYAQATNVPSRFKRTAENEDAVFQELRAQLAARQIEVIDALPALQALVRGGELPYSPTKDGHLDPRGQQLIAELVHAAVD